jgi:SPX domain protein involved in polyphosphate accumulation
MEKAVNNLGPKAALRFERKFIYSNISLEDLVETEVLSNPFCFKEIFHRRTVNNIYFDDHNLSFYHQNVSGDGLREKYRLRWYNDTFEDIHNPTFEIKKKFGEAGDKYSFKMKRRYFSLNTTSAPEIKREVADKIRKMGNLKLAEKINFVDPTLFNSYERRYFLSNCEKFRITLDYNMSFYNPNIKDLMSSKSYIDDIVLELKYEIPFDTESRGLTQHLNARLSKNSKYVTGIETITN